MLLLNKKYKKWNFGFLALIFAGSIAFAGFNYAIDPFGVATHEIIHFPNKAAQDARKLKIALAKNSSTQIDNIILGSSRVMTFGEEVSHYLGGNTFNFGVESGKPEDNLGILLFLERINKFPKHIIIGLDCSSFSPYLDYHMNFIINNDINFLKSGNKTQIYLDSFFSTDAFINSLKVIKNGLSHRKPLEQYNEWGFRIYSDQEERFKSGNYNLNKEIEDQTTNYFETSYSRGKFDKLSEERIGYFQQTIELARKHNAEVHVFINPIHEFHYNKLYEHPVLKNTMVEFKKRVVEIFPDTVDFMNEGSFILSERGFFYDSVHYTNDGAKMIAERLLNPESTTIIQGFGTK